MLMAVNEPYALMVQPDDILISPREVDEHFGTMVCFHPRYALGDHHNYMDKDDFLREMYLDTVGHDEAGMKRYERMTLFWSLAGTQCMNRWDEGSWDMISLGTEGSSS